MEQVIHPNQAERAERLLTGGFLLFNVQDMTRGGPSFHLPPPLVDAELNGLNDLPNPMDGARRTLTQAVTTRRPSSDCTRSRSE